MLIKMQYKFAHSEIDAITLSDYFNLAGRPH
jgi:hypothetical protein